MIVIRAQATDQLAYRFLVWNLFLAWVPFLLAGVTALLARRRWSAWLSVIFGGLWLLFLPNAPYIVTDFIHLGSLSSNVPQWFDATMIGLFAATGLALGYLSLAIVQAAVAQALGRRVGWFVAIGALALSTVGVYLGRVHRFNSWDALVDPRGLLQVTADRVLAALDHPVMLAVLLGSTALLIAGYAAARSLVVRRPSAG